MTAEVAKNVPQYADDDEAAMMNPSDELDPNRPKTYFGEVTIFNIGTKTSAKGNPYRSASLVIAPLRPGYDSITREMSEFSADWRRVTLPSMQALNVTITLLRDRFVQYQLTPTGEIYLAKSGSDGMIKTAKIDLTRKIQEVWTLARGDRDKFADLMNDRGMLEYVEHVKETRAIKFIAVYPDRDAATAAADNFYQRSSNDTTEPTNDGAHHGHRAPAPATAAAPVPANEAMRQFALTALTYKWQAAAGNEAEFYNLIENDPTYKALGIDRNTQEVQDVVNGIPF